MRMKSHSAKYKLTFLLLLPVLWLVAGCWQHKPAEDSTTENDSASIITLCRSYNSKTWRTTGVANNFPLYGNNDVRAIFYINNLVPVSFDRPQIFHIEWLDSENDLLYRKQVDLLPDDSTCRLESSISTSPLTRSPGTYQIRLYHFREMVACKHFELLAMESIIRSWTEQLQPEIVLYSKTRRKTGELIGVGNEFKIREKGHVRAQISFKNTIKPAMHELRLAVDWIDPDNNSFYRKDIILYPGDSLTDLSSSISIPPDKRLPGSYRLQLRLFGSPMAFSNFKLY